ncbi:hypothetical protein ACUXID_002242 [Staphylococcus epidermidis]|nr:hypothetical protein B467_01993 [Staphylococcus epidermidis M0881]BFF30588.1 hypothetical protein KUHPSE08_02260 [Staphylococcus epidermidis]
MRKLLVLLLSGTGNVGIILLKNSSINNRAILRYNELPSATNIKNTFLGY